MALILWEKPSICTSGPVDNASTGGVGVIERVSIFANGVQIGEDLTEWPYEATWTAPATGLYDVYAVVEDNEGNFGISAVQTITVREPIGDQAPLDYFAQSSDGSSLTEVSSIRLEATANDPDGSIAQVEFYVNGERNATVDYNASFLQPKLCLRNDLSPDANGSYRIYAVALDNGGNRVMSDVVTVHAVPGSDAPTITVESLTAEDRFKDEIFISLSTLNDNASTGGP